VVGETILAELLGSWLPRKAFELQYGFSNGTRVDAAIKLGNKIVPVDSKFPMEAVQRFFDTEPERSARIPADVRKGFQKHVTDISERYIRPAEGTMGFALMYIPSEATYYRLFVERPGELMAIALDRNVVPVSPGTLFLYLQTIAYGLRGLSLPEETEKLIGELSRLNEDLSAFMKSFQTAGTHLRNLTHAFDDAGSKLGTLEVTSRRLTDRNSE
jgi:DNA recombination protein RmuC